VAPPELVARLEQDVQLRLDAIRDDAAARVAEAEASTREAAAALAAAYLAQQRARREADERCALASARSKARARTLAALHAQVSHILARAHQMLDEIETVSAYAAALPAHVEDALSFVEGVPARIRCTRRLAAAVGAVVDRRPGTTIVEDDAVGPGVVVETADGGVIVDNTLRARLTQLEPELASVLAQKLSDGRH
jgi:vacuolar-type H+-ATPase subunit E/Vma4